jgi:hypothetical protein
VAAPKLHPRISCNPGDYGAVEVGARS